MDYQDENFIQLDILKKLPSLLSPEKEIQIEGLIFDYPLLSVGLF